MSARTEILGRVRGATRDVKGTPTERPSGLVLAEHSPGRDETLDRFAATVADYRAQVIRVSSDDIADSLAAVLRERSCASVVVPATLEESWVAALAGVADVVPDSPDLTAVDLDAIDTVVTAAALGIATTGTIVLDHGPDQGRRAITLVPDTHVCVIRADQIVHDVPEAVERLRPDRAHAPPLTWISGPSATSDIELQRVEGVHGPRTLVVLVVTETAPLTHRSERAP